MPHLAKFNFSKIGGSRFGFVNTLLWLATEFNNFNSAFFDEDLQIHAWSNYIVALSAKEWKLPGPLKPQSAAAL